MSSAVIQSSLTTSLLRYRRSKALWLMLLAAPIAARFMISEKEGQGISITIGSQLPVLTSPVLGVWLGIVVSTIVMPIAYLFLRANTTRRQPWQIEEVTAASRVAIAMGRFLADAAMLMLLLLVLSGAGLFLGTLLVTGPWQPLQIVIPLWIVAAPTLLVVAAIRILFDALPLLRGAMGDVVFFILWIASLAVPAILATSPSSLAINLADMAGYVRPLLEGAGSSSTDFAIGSTRLAPGRVELDVAQGLAADGYLLSRLCWLAGAVGIAALAGLVYRPHRPKVQQHKKLSALLPKLRLGGAAPAANAQAAKQSRYPWLQLLLSEMRLIAAGPLFPLLALGAALMGLIGDYRQLGSPAALLVLVFAVAAHAGRSEAPKLIALTATMPTSPAARRMAFVAAGTGWALLMSLPAMLAAASLQPLMLALITGAVISALAMVLCWAAKSPMVARLVLLVIWYGYFSTAS